MMWQAYVLVVALAAGATWVWAVRKESIGLMTSLSTTLWGYAGLKGSAITRYHHDGTSTAIQLPVFQYVAAAIAVLSVAALLLWYFGEYPPEDAADSELDPDGKPNSNGV